MKKPKTDREYPSLSILCEMFSSAQDPTGLAGYYGTFGTQQAEAYATACAELGQRLHTCLELHELGEHPIAASCGITDEREKHIAGLIKQWIRETGMKAVDCPFSENGKAIEVKLDSKLLNYSCRVDRVVAFGNSPTKWVLDYKTSSGLKDSYRLQLAGYALGWFERTGEWIDQGVLVRVEKSPKKKQQLEVLKVYELHRWVEPLVYCRELWEIMNRKGEWANVT